MTIFRDHEAFWTEWHEVNQKLDPRSQQMLHAMAIQKRHGTALTKEYQLTRERIRQLCEKAQKHLREEAYRNPDGELVHTSTNTAKCAELAGLHHVYWFRRPDNTTKTKIYQPLIQLGAIEPQQESSIIAACTVTKRPEELRPNLAGMQIHILKIIKQHPEGIKPELILEALAKWAHHIKRWPQLDINSFIKAWLNLDPSEDGKFSIPPRWEYQGQTIHRLMGQYVEQALTNAGKCLDVLTITAHASQLAQAHGAYGADHNLNENSIRNILIEKERFTWVGQSTYGLASWDVGHSNPDKKQGLRLSIADEIIYLLQQTGQPMKNQQVVDHIKSRFMVEENSVHASIHTNPSMQAHNGHVHLVKHEPNSPCSTTQLVGPWLIKCPSHLAQPTKKPAMTQHQRSQLSYAKRHAAEQAQTLERHVLQYREDNPSDMGVQIRLRQVADIMQKNLLVLTDRYRQPNEHQMKATPRAQYPSIAVDEFQRHDAQYKANITRALEWFRKASICRSKENLLKYRLQATYELGLLLEMLSGGEYQGTDAILTFKTAPDEHNNPPSP